MSRSPIIALAVAFGVGLFGAVPVAQATTLAKTTETERIASADLIVRGLVVESWTEKSQSGYVSTHVMVEPSNVLKGEAPDGAVHIAIPGGQLGAISTAVTGTARYNVGEEVLVLLEYKEKFDHYVTVSMGVGKYTVRLDPYSQRHIVQRAILPAHVRYDHRFLPLPDEENRVFADELEATIRGVVSGRIPVEVTK